MEVDKEKKQKKAPTFNLKSKMNRMMQYHLPKMMAEQNNIQRNTGRQLMRLTTKTEKKTNVQVIDMDKQNKEMGKFFNQAQTSKQSKAQQMFLKKVKTTAMRYEVLNEVRTAVCNAIQDGSINRDKILRCLYDKDMIGEDTELEDFFKRTREERENANELSIFRESLNADSTFKTSHKYVEQRLIRVDEVIQDNSKDLYYSRKFHLQNLYNDREKIDKKHLKLLLSLTLDHNESEWQTK